MDYMQVSKSDASKWLISFPADVSSTVRLICFHWAGGNGYAFRPWAKSLKDHGVEVWSMMLPGRLSRSKEAPVTNILEVVNYLVASMISLNLVGSEQPKTVFFGHSYGGIIAFELAKMLQQRSLLSVAHLIISSTNNPGVLSAKSTANDVCTKFFHKMDDKHLLDEILRHGGLPVGVHIDLLKHSIPIIRADYKSLETYVHSSVATGGGEGTVVDYRGPVTVVGGAEDTGDLSEESLRGWATFVSPEGLSFKLFAGGSHFYFMESEHLAAQVLDMILSVCRAPHTPPYPVLAMDCSSNSDPAIEA